MNSVIFCEVLTDLFLISYYFIECFGFKYCHRALPIAPKKLHENSTLESVCCYQRGDDNLVIWAVNGHGDLFVKALARILNQNKINSPTNEYFSRICVMTDNDDEDELAKFWQDMNQCLLNYGIDENFQTTRWVTAIQEISFGEKLSLELLGIPMPTTKTGALETILLNALEEQEGCTYLAERSRNFVDELVQHHDQFSNDYLFKRRQIIKAPLAVFFALISPEKTFVDFDKILRNIQWKNYQVIKDLFKPFDIFKIVDTD